MVEFNCVGGGPEEKRGTSRRVPVVFVGALAALFATSACTSTTSGGGSVLSLGPAIHDGGVVMPPPGWLDYCARNPGDVSCQAAQLDTGRLQQLRDVQATLAKIARRDDQALFGRTEFWQVADARGGDCEDIALAARAKLLALGWPASALRLATAWTEQGEYHLVLTVDVAVGQQVATLVLDSRFPEVMSFGQLTRFGYRFDTRQAAHGATWVKIDASPMRAAPGQRAGLAANTAALDAAKGAAKAPAVLAAGASLAANATEISAPAGDAGTAKPVLVALGAGSATLMMRGEAAEAQRSPAQIDHGMRLAYQEVVPQPPFTR